MPEDIPLALGCKGILRYQGTEGTRGLAVSHSLTSGYPNNLIYSLPKNFFFFPYFLTP